MKHKKVDTLLSIALQIGFIIALLFAYFWLSGKLVEWLIRIEIPVSQQDKIFQNKIYSPDEKTDYTVEKIDNLEITGFRGSSYVALKGMITLKNKTRSTRQIAFILHSHDYLTANKFKDYLPQTDIKFRERIFFTWQKFLALVLLVVSVGFFANRW